jgi:eukaryotic-like serine/threonine-protein kinase
VPPESDPFLEEAERRGILSASQAADCRRIADAMREVQVDLTVEEIASRKGFVTPDQAAEIRRALARLRVGRYEVIERLGEGAAGVVWKARDTKLDRVVALKLLSQKAQVSPSFRERFLREARIAVTLNHVNIVRGLDYGEADGYQYFAMEFVDGENAEVRLARVGRFQEREAVAIALDVVHALQYVQKFLIVHRDIKPSNLLLTPTGHVKVCDLGLAKPMLSESELLASDGMTAGTPYYMSPEQIREPEKVDWKSDVYSLGATLYHMLTGAPVFRLDDRNGVIQKHLKERPRNPREHVLELSDGVASVVLRMLQKSPDDRYGALDELASDLESVLAGRPPLHTAPPVPPEEATAERHARHAIARRITEKTLPRERFPWPIAAMFALMVAGFGIVALNRGGAKPAAPDQDPGQPPPATVSDPPKSAPRPESSPPQPATAPAPAPGADTASRAQAAFDELVKSDVRNLAADGHFAAAIRRLRDFAVAYPGTDEASRRVPEEVKRLDVLAHGRFDEMVRRANEAAAQHRFDEARTRIGEAQKVESDWADAEGRKALALVDAAARDYEHERESQAGAFAELCGQALLEAGTAGIEAARALVDRKARDLTACDQELSDLRDDLDLMNRRGLDPDTINATSERGAYALLLARLARGEVELAGQALEHVRDVGGDADAARRKLTAVRDVLARRAGAALDAAEMELSAGRYDAALRAVADAQRILPGYAPAVVLTARIRLAKDETDQAIQLMSALLAGGSAPPEAHLVLGQALARKGDDLARAEAEMRRYLEAVPADEQGRGKAQADYDAVHARRVETEAKAWRELAMKYRANNAKQNLTEGAWGRVLEVSPDDPDALLGLARIYRDTKRSSQAAVLLAQVARCERASDAQKRQAADMLVPLRTAGVPISAEDGRGSAATAAGHFAREDWVRCVTLSNLALSLSPHLVSARVTLIRANLALAHEQTGRTDYAKDAVDDADFLVQRYPEDTLPVALRAAAALPLALRADAELLLGETSKARDDAYRAKICDPRCAAAHLALGRAQLAAGAAADAVKSFQEAVAIDAAEEALLGLARAYIADGDRESARGVLATCKARFGMTDAYKDVYRLLNETK